jgi:hypothetical protein
VNLGRWAETDPIGFAGGDYNLYRYVQNNFINEIDPSGLYSIADCLDRLKEINDIKEELMNRWQDMRDDAWHLYPIRHRRNGVQYPRGNVRYRSKEKIGSWPGHLKQYTGLQKRLRKEIKAFKDGCGPPDDWQPPMDCPCLDPAAWRWATKTAPAEPTQNNPETPPNPEPSKTTIKLYFPQPVFPKLKPNLGAHHRPNPIRDPYGRLIPRETNGDYRTAAPIILSGLVITALLLAPEIVIFSPWIPIVGSQLVLQGAR